MSGYFFAILGDTNKSHHAVDALDFLDVSAMGNELSSSFEEGWLAGKLGKLLVFKAGFDSM